MSKVLVCTIKGYYSHSAFVFFTMYQDHLWLKWKLPVGEKLIYWTLFNDLRLKFLFVQSDIPYAFIPSGSLLLNVSFKYVHKSPPFYKQMYLYGYCDINLGFHGSVNMFLFTDRKKKCERLLTYKNIVSKYIVSWCSSIKADLVLIYFFS